MVEIHLHGHLATLVDGPLTLDVATPAEAFRALCVLVDGFEEALRGGEYRLDAGGEEVGEHSLHLALGAGGRFDIHPVASGGVYGWVIYAAVALLAFVAAYALAPSVQDYTERDAPEERASYLFDGAVNSQAQGGPVPLIFGGPIRVGSTVVSLGITSSRVGAFRNDYRDIYRYPDGYVPPLGAGGKSKARTPVEGANTLQTSASIRLVDLLGEGEMRGLIDGLKSVYIDGVPVQNADDSYNTEGIEVEWQPGLPDQPALERVPSVETVRVVNVQLERGAGADPERTVRVINNAAVDTARVTLRFPRLVKTDATTGDTGPASVEFSIEVQSYAGGTQGAYEVHTRQTIRDKNTSPAELSWEVPLDGDAPHNIRLTRWTADSGSDKLQHDLFWARLDEIVSIRQTYPNSAIVGITAEADKATGQVSKREYDVYGLIVDVPDNYNPQTRAYTGMWDGTFKRAWSDNPAWCVYYLLKNRRFGLGAEISQADIAASKWDWYRIAMFCDVEVPDGEAGMGMEPRYRFTGVVAKRQDAAKLLRHMMSAFRGNFFFGGGLIQPIQDAPAGPAALIGNASVKDGSFRYGDLPWGERYSAVNVSFNDPDDSYKLGIEPLVDDDLVAKYGYRVLDKVAMFCTRRSQAQRHGRHILLEQEYESDSLEFTAALEQASLRPGQVFKQSDTRIAGARYHYRITHVHPGFIIALVLSAPIQETLERLGGGVVHGVSPNRFVNTTAGWSISVVLPDGSVGTANIYLARETAEGLGLSYNQATWTNAGRPAVGAILMLENTAGVQPREWRVATLREVNDMEYRFTAHSYLPAATHRWSRAR